MKTPNYLDAVLWIANEDNPGDNESVEFLSGYLTVALVADLFGKDQKEVAMAVWRIRNTVPSKWLRAIGFEDGAEVLP
jgi:hypothetical protein